MCHGIQVYRLDNFSWRFDVASVKFVARICDNRHFPCQFRGRFSPVNVWVMRVSFKNRINIS